MNPAPDAAQPGPAATPDIERVRLVLDQIRPHVQADGGDIELVAITPDGIVQVRMLGSCHGCPSSEVTLTASIERNLLANATGVRGVKVVA